MDANVAYARLVSHKLDYSAGTREEYPMIKAGTHGENDLWSVSISPKESGIYGYKFVLNDTKE